MNDLVAGLIRWTLRLVVVALGLVVFLSLLCAAALLAVVWSLRAVWARVTGRPVMPWAMRMDPRTGWSTVYRSTARWSARGAAAGAAPADEPAPGVRSRELPGARDVSDVEPREVR
ncbi:MAG: hypothetical protein EOO32_05830 [Comamonadaceae bacterium]|nr:MAG: hypothetical protein EOO32_05830 [Comamonadaceae bacterium]